MFIKDNSAWVNIDIACEYLELTRSSYYSWLSNYDKHLQKEAENKKLTDEVVQVFKDSKYRYGSRQISIALANKQIICDRKKAANIMQANNLVPCGYKKFKVTTTNSSHKHRVFDNLLERNFKTNKPNAVWVGDITYIRTNEGWLYLATVIDLFSRKIIGYKMSNRMTKDLVISALSMALKARNYPTGVIVHSDRGSQYASNEYKAMLTKHGLLGSMSKKGDCWDNAVAESFFATLKKEYVYQTIFKTRTDAQLGIFDYIETWYNRIRFHSTLNGLSPMEFEAKYQFENMNNNLRIKPNTNSYSKELNV